MVHVTRHSRAVAEDQAAMTRKARLPDVAATRASDYLVGSATLPGPARAWSSRA